MPKDKEKISWVRIPIEKMRRKILQMLLKEYKLQSLLSEGLKEFIKQNREKSTARQSATEKQTKALKFTKKPRGIKR